MQSIQSTSNPSAGPYDVAEPSAAISTARRTKQAAITRSVRSTVAAAFGLLSLLLLVPETARAATIVWGGPQNITGDNDVSTSGALVGAFNVGTTNVASTTINGVPFQSFAIPTGPGGATVGNFAINSGGTFVSSNTTFGTALAPFNSLSSSYQTLLRAGTFNQQGFALVLSGLAAGAQYQFQWWANFSSAASATLVSTATAGNSVSLFDNVTNTNGGLGQWAIGTFTADSATQVINFGPTGPPEFALLNGFQLRRIEGAAVPDTGSSLALFALAFSGLALGHMKSARLRKG